MRFAALVLCILSLAGLSARAEGVADHGAEMRISAGLRTAGDLERSEGFARLSLDAPVAAGFALRGQIDLGTEADGGQGDLRIGAGLRLDRDHWSALADLTYDIAAQGASAETGIDLVTRAGQYLTLEAGPRIFLGSAQLAEGDHPPAAGGPHGLFTAGLRLSARYDPGGDWGLDGILRLDQPVLGDDPGGEEASPARLSATIMATHRFQLEF